MKFPNNNLKRENVVKVSKNKKKKVHFNNTLCQTFTYTKNIDDEEHENNKNEFTLKQRELYIEEINEYLISEVDKQKPDYHFDIDEFDIKGNLFLFERKNKLYMVFFHDGELECKIIPFVLNTKISETFLDLFFKEKLDELIFIINDINEYFHLNVLNNKIN